MDDTTVPPTANSNVNDDNNDDNEDVVVIVIDDDNDYHARTSPCPGYESSGLRGYASLGAMLVCWLAIFWLTTHAAGGSGSRRAGGSGLKQGPEEEERERATHPA